MCLPGRLKSALSVRGAEGQLGRVRGALSSPLLPSARRALATVASGKERDRRDELPHDVLVIGLAVLWQMTYEVCL